MSTVNEGTTAYLTISFYDKNNVLAVPASISYRIDCLTNDQEVKGDTAVGAASSIEVELTKTNNAIIDQTNHSEKRLVTVTAGYGDDDQIVEEYQYNLMNMTKKPSP